MQNKKLVGRIALFVTTLIWGTSFVVLKATLDNAPVLWILALRFLGAALIMLLLSLKELKKLDRAHLLSGVLMGVMLFFAYIFQTYGLAGTTPGKNAFLTAGYCVIVPFLYWIFQKKRPDRCNVAAAVVCITGVGLVSLTGDLSIAAGDGLTLIGSVFFALHIIATDRGTEGRSVLILSFLQMATAGILALGSSIAFEPFPTGLPASSAASIAYLCVMCTAACFFLQTYGQKHTPPSETAVIMTFESVFGALISALMGQEELSFRLILGFALIFAAVIISETKPRIFGGKSASAGDK